MITKKLVIDYHYACTSGKGIAVQFLFTLLADYLFKRLFYKMLTVLCIVSFFRVFCFMVEEEGKRKRGKGRGESNAHRRSSAHNWYLWKGKCFIAITGRACKATNKISEFHNWEIEASSIKMPGLSYFQKHAQKHILTSPWTSNCFRHSSVRLENGYLNYRVSRKHHTI